MTRNRWRTAYSSVIGTSHERAGTPCQDASYCRIIQDQEGNDILLAVCSDGAGSATRSEIGSRLTVDSFLVKFGDVIRKVSLCKIDRDFVLNWLESLKVEISERAELEGLNSKEFACTVLAALVGPDNAIFFQIGDGAIVISEVGSKDYSPMFWPQHGEFANQTNFILQDNIEKVLEFAFIKQSLETVSIFTDGIERLVLDFSSRTVHGPAFYPIFDWLEKCEPSSDESPSSALTAYLNSNSINSRTDDDKTLVMATRALT